MRQITNKLAFTFGNSVELCLLILVVWCCFPADANAGYLDPGSGSTLVQGVVAILAVVGRVRAKIRGFFRPANAEGE